MLFSDVRNRIHDVFPFLPTALKQKRLQTEGAELQQDKNAKTCYQKQPKGALFENRGLLHTEIEHDDAHGKSKQKQ